MKEQPKYVFKCQAGCPDFEAHLLPATAEHKKKTGHAEYYLHVNGEEKV